MLANIFQLFETMCYQFLQRKCTFYHQNTLLYTSQTNYRNIIGRNPSMVIPLLANQDLTPMLPGIVRESSITLMQVRKKKTKTN